MIPLPPKVLRRIVLAPVVCCCCAALVVLSPVLFVFAGLIDLFAGGRRTLRFVAFGVTYCAYEVVGMGAVFWLWLASGAGRRIRAPAFQERHYRLMAWWLAGLQTVAVRLFHIVVDIEDRPPPQAGPILVFSRHGGAGNSLLLVATLLLEYERRPRIIMLEKLQWEPLFDILLNRLPNRFIRHGAAGREAQVEAIGALASGLGDRDAFVLFPEGHDFKPQLRLRAIAHLRKRGYHDSAAQAERMANVLPPRHGGVMAAIANAPDADIVFVTHTLFEDVGSIGQLWQRIPLTEPVRARFWRIPVAEVPKEQEALIAWLYAWWSRVDAWISDKVTEPEAARGDVAASLVDPADLPDAAADLVEPADVPDPSTPLL
jgi:hypothetical protein